VKGTEKNTNTQRSSLNTRGQKYSEGILETQRKRKNISVGEERPLMWGHWAWTADPPAKTVTPRTVTMIIKLAKNGSPIDRPTALDRSWFEHGDSNHSTPSEAAAHLTARTTFGEAKVRLHILANAEGRIAALRIEADGAHTLIDGYHFARLAFDALNVSVTAKTGVPLVEAAMWLSAPLGDGIEVAARFKIPFPDVKFDVTPNVSPLYPMLLTFYAEAVRTNSAFYAFLLYFQLAEFLLGRWQGAIRKVARERKVSIPDITSELSGKDMELIAPYLAGKRYTDIIRAYRSTFRNAVAHFNLEFGGAKPLLSRAEDDVAVARDVLRIASAHLLETTAVTLGNFLDCGCDPQEIAKRITTELQKTTPKGGVPKGLRRGR
jgi:hypothetical protein